MRGYIRLPHVIIASMLLGGYLFHERYEEYMQYKRQNGDQNVERVAAEPAAQASSMNDKLDAAESFNRCDRQSRLSYLAEACGNNRDRYHTLTSKKYNGIVVNHQLKIVYCGISKVATTTMRNYYTNLNRSIGYLQAYAGDHDRLAAMGFVPFPTLSAEEKQNVKKNYLSYMTVRHPWERLISTYNNKISCNTCNKLNIVLNATKSVSGTPFAKFLYHLSNNYNSSFCNPHWADYDDTCAYCDFPFQHIFKTETLAEDFEIVVDHLKSVFPKHEIPTLVHANNANAIDPTKKLKQVYTYFKDANISTLKGLWDIYGKSFVAFGYDYSPKRGATCSIKLDNGQFCC